MNECGVPQRVLLAKVGLDGHDRGIKVVARGLRDAGFHVIYSGLWQQVESVAQAAQDEDVDWLGISILNGTHMKLIPQVLDALRRRDTIHISVIVGGTIPSPDQEKLKQLGVEACFGSGASIEKIVEFLTRRSQESNNIPMLVRQLEQGNRAALARLLTLAAADRDETFLLAAVKDLSKGSPPVIALTGSGGVGKSSLLGELATHFAQRGERVGVLACDPESPVTGGALLGDRCRITGDSAGRVFVRSLAIASGRQGIAPNMELMVGLMKAFGFGRIFIETVGTGQGDTAVGSVADTVVLVVQPQTGDELQWEKAGILEIADMVVVNKSDLPGADHTLSEVTQQLQKTVGPTIPIVMTSIARKEGIEEFCRVLDSVQPSKREKT